MGSGSVRAIVFCAALASCAGLPRGPAVPTEGLAGEWLFSGGPADTSGNGDDAAAVGARLASDRFGRDDAAYRLDGRGDYLAVADAKALRLGTGDFSICLWVYFGTLANEQVLIEKYIEGYNSDANRMERGPEGWFLSKLADDSFRFRGSDFPRPPSLAAGRWTFLALTREAGALTFYANAEISGGGAPAHDAGNVDCPSALRMGHRGGPGDTPGSLDKRGFYFNGLMDDVRIYRRALSRDELFSLYHDGGWRSTEAAEGPAPASAPRTADRAGSEAAPAAAAAPPRVSSIPMILVDGGTFAMGMAAPLRDFPVPPPPDMTPAHEVAVTGFLMGACEVTQEQYEAVTGADPSTCRGEGPLPADSVTWYEAVEFCNALSAREGREPCYIVGASGVECDFSKNGYRLPTEAEWEFAARGGTKSRGYQYCGSDTARDVTQIWYPHNYAVASKAPNELGLYDMSGNVAEWCWDYYGDYSASARSDPAGPSTGAARCLRSGLTRQFYSDSWLFLSPAWRDKRDPMTRDDRIGLRVVRRIE